MLPFLKRKRKPGGVAHACHPKLLGKLRSGGLWFQGEGGRGRERKERGREGRGVKLFLKAMFPKPKLAFVFSLRPLVDVYSLIKSSQQLCEVGAFILSLQLRKLRLRRVRKFGQDHTVKEWQAEI